MKNKWIKKGDKALVVSGNDRGKFGEVIARKKDRVIIQGVNVRKRHTKSREQNRKSEIISMEMPVHISNVALCDGDGKKLCLKVRTDKEGNKELMRVDNSGEASYRTLRKSVKS